MHPLMRHLGRSILRGAVGAVCAAGLLAGCAKNPPPKVTKPRSGRAARGRGKNRGGERRKAIRSQGRIEGGGGGRPITAVGDCYAPIDATPWTIDLARGSWGGVRGWPVGWLCEEPAAQSDQA